HIRDQAWQTLLADVKANPQWKEALGDVDLEIDRDHDRDLIFRVKQAVDRKSWNEFLTKFREKYADKLKDKPEIKLDTVPQGNLAALLEAVKPASLPADEVKKLFDTTYKPLAEQDVKDFVARNYLFGTSGQRKD